MICQVCHNQLSVLIYISSNYHAENQYISTIHKALDCMLNNWQKLCKLVTVDNFYSHNRTVHMHQMCALVITKKKKHYIPAHITSGSDFVSSPVSCLNFAHSSFDFQ